MEENFNEEWRDVVGYEGLYQVSVQGRVRSLNFNHTGEPRVLKAKKEKIGYLKVNLFKNNIGKMFSVHQLVAKAFLENPEEKPCIDHINTIKDDNRVQNLRWCTQKENCNNQLTLKKLSEANKGKFHTEETKKKMSKAKCKTVYMIDKETGDILNVFRSTKEAKRITKINQAHISSCCNGKRKSAGGYKWEYLKV